MKPMRFWSAVFVLLLSLSVGACSDDGGSGSDGGADGGADTGDGGGPDDGGDGGGDTGDPDVATDLGGGDVLDEPDLPGPVGDPVTVAVGDVFAPGTALRDAYGGDRALVDANGDVTIIMHPNGVLLLERDEARGAEADFSWLNPVVYFLITDRFDNGDPSNDNSYGRQPAAGETVGTFHGGDFAGIVDRLDYIASLGVNAIWITPPIEQIHGWVGGGSGDFQYFPYHGYWAQDFTRLDANLGDEDDLRELVTAAHDRGIRVLFDIVMNHPGYASLEDLGTYVPSVLSPGWEDWTPGPGQNWHAYNDLFIDFESEDWVDWWGPAWIRAGFPLHPSPGPGDDDLTSSLAFLPDFRTEWAATSGLPPFLQVKDDTGATEIAGGAVRDYLVTWHTRWVRDFGIDGFRCDTAKHVELESWAALDAEARDALSEWKDAHPGDALDDLDFWMTGEAFPPLRGVSEGQFYNEGGFDSLINFEFQTEARGAAQDHAELERLFGRYAGRTTSFPERGQLSYISSHDTHLYFERHGRDVALQRDTGTALLLLPGGIQIFYGDESGRRNGPAASLPTEATRSDMNWNGLNNDLVWHWQRVGRFRNHHIAIGAGSHQQMTYADGYMFSRDYEGDGWTDEVVVVLAEE